jgi:hypothetical protein
MLSSSTTTSWPHLHQALRPLDRQLRDRGVVRRRPVERRGDDLALHRPLHVGDFLGPLVDEDDHEVALGVVRGDRVRDVLHDRGLAGLRRRHDQRALALADRHHQVDDPGGQLVRLGLQAQPLVRVERRELGELGPVPGDLRVLPVQGVHADQGVELLPALLALAGLAHGTGDGVAAAQAVAADHRQRHVDVGRPGQVAGGADERVVVEDVDDAGDGQQHVVVADLGVDGVLPALLAGAVAVAAPATVPEAASTPAAAVTVVVAVVVAGVAVVALAPLVRAAAAVVVPIVPVRARTAVVGAVRAGPRLRTFSRAPFSRAPFSRPPVAPAALAGALRRGLGSDVDGRSGHRCTVLALVRAVGPVTARTALARASGSGLAVGLDGGGSRRGPRPAAREQRPRGTG